MLQKITPFLWFDGKAEEAARFYTSIFKDSRIDAITHYGEGMPAPKGSVMTVKFLLEGQEFVALNGGPIYKFTPAISFVVNCDTQPEVDTLWDKLTADGGAEVQCGWLTDKFGLSWQIVPKALVTMLSSTDTAAAQRAANAMMQMKKIDIAVMEKAFKNA